MGSTNVYSYLDDDSTPFLTSVPVSSTHVTLGDFKKALPKKNLTYSQKVFDENIDRHVKRLLQDDDEPLIPNENGVIELFLTSNNTNTGTLKSNNRHYKHLPAHLAAYGAGSSICGDLDLCGGQRVSMVTAEPSVSGAGSYLSKRAGEQLASLDNTSASEDPYGYDQGCFTEQSSAYLRVVNNVNETRRRTKRERYRKAYVPSTISSQSGMSSMPQVTEITLDLREHPLGISVATYDGAVLISRIQRNSAADLCGALEVGDQIIQVDTTSFEDLSEDQIVQLLRKISSQKRPVHLVAARYHRTSDQRSDALSALCETAEIDVSRWVEGTKQANVEPPFEDEPQNNTAHENHAADETSDEERAAYDDRRNGIGAHFVPQVQMFRNLHGQHIIPVQPIEQNTLPLRHDVPNDENEKQVRLTSIDPMEVVVRQMARPDSGLKVKDRKWLKIPIPMSFIGHELVNWLLENVHGFSSRKQARAYAKQLLDKGLIRHAVNMSTFSEKCYYKFREQFCEERLLLEQQTKLNNAESPTEITYMSGPSSPRQQHRQVTNGFHTNGIDPVQVLQQRPLNYGQTRGPALPPKQPIVSASHTLPLNSTQAMKPLTSTGGADLSKWQLSPITMVNQSRQFPRDCDSPTVSGIYDVVKQ